MRITEYLRLMRIQNIFTALADVWAGYFLVLFDAGQTLDNTRLIALLVASGCIYSAGMVFNDVFDAVRDRELHPERPLPSGRVSVRAACILGSVLMMAGLAGAIVAGAASAIVAAVVIGLTFTYNGWLKNYRIAGSANMAACRFGNMLLGMSTAVFASWTQPYPKAMVFPGLLFLYVFVVTLISTLEESKRPRLPLAALLAAQMAVLALLVLRLHFAYEVSSTVLAALGLLAAWVLVTSAGAFLHPTARSIGQIIRISLMGIILFDATMLLGVAQSYAGRGMMSEGSSLHNAAKVLLLLMMATYALGRMLARRPAASPDAASG